MNYDRIDYLAWALFKDPADTLLICCCCQRHIRGSGKP